MASELSLFSIGRYDIYTSNITLASGRTIPEWTFIDPAHLRGQADHHAQPCAAEGGPRLLRDEVRALPGQQHRRSSPTTPPRSTTPWRPRTGRSSQHYQPRHDVPRDHAPVVGRQRLADRLERHHPQRGSGAVLRVPVPLRGRRLHDHHDRAGQLQPLHSANASVVHHSPGRHDHGGATVRLAGVRSGARWPWRRCAPPSVPPTSRR